MKTFLRFLVVFYYFSRCICAPLDNALPNSTIVVDNQEKLSSEAIGKNLTLPTDANSTSQSDNANQMKQNKPIQLGYKPMRPSYAPNPVPFQPQIVPSGQPWPGNASEYANFSQTAKPNTNLTDRIKEDNVSANTTTTQANLEPSVNCTKPQDNNETLAEITQKPIEESVNTQNTTTANLEVLFTSNPDVPNRFKEPETTTPAKPSFHPSPGDNVGQIVPPGKPWPANTEDYANFSVTTNTPKETIQLLTKLDEKPLENGTQQIGAQLEPTLETTSKLEPIENGTQQIRSAQLEPTLEQTSKLEPLENGSKQIKIAQLEPSSKLEPIENGNQQLGTAQLEPTSTLELELGETLLENGTQQIGAQMEPNLETISKLEPTIENGTQQIGSAQLEPTLEQTSKLEALENGSKQIKIAQLEPTSKLEPIENGTQHNGTAQLEPTSTLEPLENGTQHIGSTQLEPTLESTSKLDQNMEETKKSITSQNGVSMLHIQSSKLADNLESSKLVENGVEIPINEGSDIKDEESTENIKKTEQLAGTDLNTTNPNQDNVDNMEKELPTKPIDSKLEETINSTQNATSQDSSPLVPKIADEVPTTQTSNLTSDIVPETTDRPQTIEPPIAEEKNVTGQLETLPVQPITSNQSEPPYNVAVIEKAMIETVLHEELTTHDDNLDKKLLDLEIETIQSDKFEKTLSDLDLNPVKLIFDSRMPEAPRDDQSKSTIIILKPTYVLMQKTRPFGNFEPPIPYVIPSYSHAHYYASTPFSFL